MFRSSFIKGLVYNFWGGVGDTSEDLLQISNNLAESPQSGNGVIETLAYENGTYCVRCVSLLQRLQTNVIRTYPIDPSKDHSLCMNSLGNAGIYVFVDLVTPGFGISIVNPVWNDGLYSRYASVIDAMHGYPNLLGFIIGDNVVTGIGHQLFDTGPFVKAAVRDMKAYMRQKNYRAIPVGYIDSTYGSAYKNAAPSLANDTVSNYLNCDRQDETVDFWGLSMLNRSGPRQNLSDYMNSPNNRILSLANYSVPVFIASYGGKLRDWERFRNDSEILFLYGERMSQTWSGGLIYEFMGDYGRSIASRPVSKFDFLGLFRTQVLTITPEFNYVSSLMAQISPSGVELAKYTPTNTAAACPIGAATSLPPNPMAPISPISSQDVPSTNFQNVSTHKLSPREKISIGITAPISVLTLGTVLFLCLKARKTNRTLQEQVRDAQWTKKELAADDIDPEARGYGPHMPASTERAELEDTGIAREVPTEGNQILEAPGDAPTLPEPLYTSFEEEFLARFCELTA